MRHSISQFWCCAVPLSAAVLCTVLVSGSKVIADEPVGFDVVRRCVEVSGGADAFANVRTMVMKGSVTVTSNKAPQTPLATGTLTTYYAAPDRAKVVVDLKPFGKTEQGVRGIEGWEDSGSGARSLSDAERTRLIDSISLRESFAPTEVFSSITNMGQENVNGVPCYRVEVQRRGRTDKDQIFYSIETGLPARTMATRATGAPQGGVVNNQVIDSTILQYQTFEGLQIATQVRQYMANFGLTHEVTIESVEMNREIDDSVFAVPAIGKKAK